jgi:DNA-binding response OmpR family regulator
MMKLAPAERPANMAECAAMLAALPSLGPLEVPVATSSSQPQQAQESPVEEAPAPVQIAETPALMLVGPRKERADLEQAADAVARLTLVTNSPKEAAELLTVRRPQGIVLFLTMSIAWNEVTALAARCRSNDIPFFVVAAPELGQSRLLATRLGCKLFFHLPFSPAEILQNIEEVLGLQQLPTARVMAVDDDDIALAAMEAVFVVNELEFYGVSEPTQFWKSLEEVQPDFLILDFEMPGATGLDLCRMVRGDPRWRLLPILILTAATDRGLVNAVYEAGADDYATKPMRSEDLVVRVLNRIKRHRVLGRVSVSKPMPDPSSTKSSPGLLHAWTPAS